MKQTSLLDSFLKRQNKQADNQINNSNQKPANNVQNSKESNKKQENNKNIAMTSSKNINKKWTTLDSDDDQDYIQNCKNKIKNMDIEYNPKGDEQMDIQNQEQYEVQKPKQKRQKQNKIMESEKVVKKQTKREMGIQKNKQEEDNFLDQFTDATPVWAQRQYCKDAQMRSPDHPNYDPTTLYIPDEAWSKFTAPMKQFWKTKSQNFDKVILFKLGKFYQLFYQDAMIGNKYLELKYMGTKMHTGFPEKTLNKYIQQLVRLGFKTVIMEQMQTPDQMQERIKKDKAQGRKSEKTLNREITQIVTKGTLPNQDGQNYLPNYLISIRLYGDMIAFSLLQISSNQILLGLVNNIDQFKTVLFQTRPVEVVFDPDNVPFQMLRMMEKSFLQMQISKVVNKNNLWHPLTAICQLQKLQKQGKIKKAKIFQALAQFPENNKNLIYSTLSGMFDYLKKVFKFEYVITSTRFTFYQKQNHKQNMVLDSQSLQHLEIFETAEGQADSLFNTIDKTKTKFGKRLLRRWLMSPLMNVYHINQRLNAVEDLQQISVDREKVGNVLKKLPDLQKKVNKLYHYAIKTTSASKAIYFEDLNTSRLKQFRDLMEKMEISWQAINILSKKSNAFKSLRLKQLVTLTRTAIKEDDVYYEDEDDQSAFEGLLPDVIDALQQFKLFVKWENDLPVPQKGLAASFDNLQDQIENVKKELDEYLESIRFQMKESNLKFVHTKERYEIQIPQKSQKRRPQDFQFTSKRAGFSRYASSTTRKYVKTLEKLEESIKEQMGLFVGFFFEQFKKKQKVWQRYIEVLAEIDCLISLSEYSFSNSKVRPQFCEDQHKFEIREAKHPCLGHIDFIPNDIILDKKVMLLTGPNMGGKSTILRTACTLAILAQIGCFVPAEKYQCETIDRIFTRIGASDKLELGKSTFFIEMEETKSVLTHGTQKSFAIIDELGRGTSTFDGMAIAYSVLREIISEIKCYCLFATHYHVLVDQFEREPEVSEMMMDSIINNGRLIFLYKLVPGHVDQSFGINVAKLVGIPSEAINLAEVKALQMNNQIQAKRNTILQQIYNFIE